MINIPEWITAGTAVTAVLGGLFGVYTSTSNDVLVERERLNALVGVVARIGTHQEQLSLTTMEMKERVIKSEVGADYLQRGQDNLSISVNELNGKVGHMNDLLIKMYAEQKD